MKHIKNRFILGLIFSSIALLFWGALPVALKLASVFIDALTLTWVRFLVAFIVTFSLQLMLGNLAAFKKLSKKDWVVLVIASVFLVVNYNTFVWSLEEIHLGSAQLNFQTAPFFLAIGGAIFQKDRVHLLQWLFFATLAMGMLIFFHPFLSQDADVSIVKGIAFVQLSSMSWSIYALLQKSMLTKISPSNVMLSIYMFGIVIMLPFTNLDQLAALEVKHWQVIAFCALNTLVAYGAFAQAMKYWETVQVSAMIALTPIASFASAEMCVILLWWPDIIKSANLDMLSLFGMSVVLISSVAVQLVSKYMMKLESKTRQSIEN